MIHALNYRWFALWLLLLLSVSGMSGQGYVMNDSTEYQLNTIDSRTFTLSGEPGMLTFDARRSMLGLGSLYVDVWNGGVWERIVGVSLSTEYEHFGPYSLPHTATRIRFSTEFGATLYKYFKHIVITGARYIECSEPALFTYSDYEQQLTVRYADVAQPIMVTSSSTAFQVVSPVGTIGASQGSGESAVTVRFYPDTIGPYDGQLTLSDGRTVTQVALAGVWSLASNEQQIVWEQSFTDVHLGDTFILNAYSTSGLPVSYSTEHSDVIRLFGDTLVAHALGYAQVVAEQVGDGNFMAAPSLRSYVYVSELPTAITAPSEVSVMVYPNPVKEG